MDSVTSEIEAIVSSLSLDSKDTKTDPVVQALEVLLVGKVGDPLAETDHAEAVREGLRRVDAELPPGYKDKKKGDESAAGDYLVWTQAVAEAQNRSSDLLILTNDVKEDWWRLIRGESRGPRVELVDEFRGATGKSLYMMRPETLLRNASTILGLTVSESVVEEVERVDRAIAGEASDDWTIEAIEALLTGLVNVGGVQRLAILAAAKNDGFVSRDQVYALAGYEETRTLRGFTRPSSRVAQNLRDKGILASSAPDPLSTAYDPAQSYVLASGFRVPGEFVRYVRVSGVD